VARHRARELFDITAGFVYSQVLLGCVQLDLFERLAAGPLTLEALSRDTGMQSDRLLRLLQAACSLRLLQARGDNGYGLGDLGAAARGNPGIAAMVRHHQSLYRDLADPEALLRSGGNTQLSAFWPYARGGAGAVDGYSDLMAASQAFIAQEILRAYPLRDFEQLWDVAGGDGAFLATALQRWPHLNGNLLDLPPVAARAAQRFEGEQLQSRACAIGGNMFDAPFGGARFGGQSRGERVNHGMWIPGRPGLVTLIRVLHDHDDGPVLTLLQNLRQSWPARTRLLIAEPMAETRNAEPMGHAYFGFYLLAMGSGRPRSASELRSLLARSGFTRCKEVATGLPLLLRMLVAEP
jgi:demethylspheroidene O-methyltransferase